MRVAGMQFYRQALVDLPPAELDYATLMSGIVRGVSDSSDRVANPSLYALFNVFATEGEAPEGLAAEVLDELMPALSRHFESSDSEVRQQPPPSFARLLSGEAHMLLPWQVKGTAMQAIGVLARNAGEAMVPHAPVLIPMLLTVLQSAGPEGEESQEPYAGCTNSNHAVCAVVP